MIKKATWNYEELGNAIRDGVSRDQRNHGGGQGSPQEYEDYGGNYDPAELGMAMENLEGTQYQKYMAEQAAQAKAEQKAEAAKPAAFGPANLANLGRGLGSGTGDTFTKDLPLDIGSSLLPGGMVRSYPRMAQSLWNAPGEIYDSIGKGNYGDAALTAGGSLATLAIPGALGIRAANAARTAAGGVPRAFSWGQRALQAGKGFTDPVTGGARGAWDAMKTVGSTAKDIWGAVRGAQPGVSTWQAVRSAVPSAKTLAPMVQAAPGGKVIPGLGAGLAVAANTMGAVTGDQNYLSGDSFGGNMVEQAMRTMGDLQAARSLGPLGFIGVGAATAANVGANAWRAGGDLLEQSRASDRLEQIQKHNADPEFVAARRARNADRAKGIKRDASGKIQQPEAQQPEAAKPPVTPSTPPAGTAAADPKAATKPVPPVPGGGPTGAPPLPMTPGRSDGETNVVGR